MNGELIGMVRLGRADRAETLDSNKSRVCLDGIAQSWNLAFFVHPQRWRQGYATEFTREALSLSFDELGADAMKASAPTWNAASQAVLARLGFTVQRENPDGYRIHGESAATFEYGITAESWRAGRKNHQLAAF